MLTESEIKAIWARPGSFKHWCAVNPTSEPFWSHVVIGRELHIPTPDELANQRRRALELEELAEQIRRAAL